MKRKALLIGNSNGLPGVKLDLDNYAKFLKSDTGGQWFDSEIKVMMNPTKVSLLKTIHEMESDKPDYAFVVFSGHGAYSKNTILEINEKEECINEKELKNISLRQISIFDCCRNVVIEPLFESRSIIKGLYLSDSDSRIRKMYEKRIMQAIEQQISLYACSVGESASDTEGGGLYSKNLLKSAREINNDSFLTVGNVHEKAIEKIETESLRSGKHNQNPSAILPRCLTYQQLIFSINPNINI